MAWGLGKRTQRGLYTEYVETLEEPRMDSREFARGFTGDGAAWVSV